MSPTDTISATHLVVFPASSLTVSGLPSLIRSRAAEQSICKQFYVASDKQSKGDNNLLLYTEYKGSEA